MNTYRCIVCLDSGYLAVHKDDESKVVPMCDLSGSQLTDYRLVKSECKKQQEEVNKIRLNGNKQYQNWQPEQKCEAKDNTSYDQMGL